MNNHTRSADAASRQFSSLKTLDGSRKSDCRQVRPCSRGNSPPRCMNVRKSLHRFTILWLEVMGKLRLCGLHGPSTRSERLEKREDGRDNLNERQFVCKCLYEHRTLKIPMKPIYRPSIFVYHKLPRNHLPRVYQSVTPFECIVLTHVSWMRDVLTAKGWSGIAARCCSSGSSQPSALREGSQRSRRARRAIFPPRVLQCNRSLLSPVSNSLQSVRVKLQRACTSYGLPIAFVLDVSSCEDAIHTGQSTSGRCDKVAILVHFQLPLE